MRQIRLQALVCFLLVLQLTSARRLFPRHSSSLFDGDDDWNDWPSDDWSDWPSDAPGAAAPVDDGYQTFTRDGATLRVKPHQQTIRIGGTNVPPEQMIRQAELMKGLEPVAVRQLLATKQPVVRTTFENGQKRTSTYTLESDGSITCKTVEDVDPKMVDAEFEKLFQRHKQQQQQQQQPQQSEPKTRTQTNWDWASPSVQPQPLAPVTPTKQWTPQQPQPARAPTSTRGYPQLPESWNQSNWPQHRDPFNPAELPSVGTNDDDDDFDDPFFTNPYSQTYESQTPKTVTTTTHTDKDGSTVQTTFTMGPNEWKRKTVKITKQNLSPPSNTTPQIPNLEEFLRAQYDATSTTPRPLYNNYDVLRTTTAAYNDKPVTTINVNDLPLMAVLNNGQPVDAHYLRNYPTELQPLTGDNQTPIKTIKIEDITPTPERVETTKMKTVTKTLHSDVLPTAADLDPNMLAMLQRAGIKPEDILAANGNAITKTRVEPDGRVVKTTYRVRTMPASDVPSSYVPSAYEPSNPPPLFKQWQPSSTDAQAGTPYARPAHFPEETPTQTATRHYSASRSGVQFTPTPSTSTSTTTVRPVHERDREPLEPAITLNPMHIHPIQQPAPVALPAAPSHVRHAISDFLAKIGLTMDDILRQNGEMLKTITDDDGDVLTVRFMLSTPTAPLK